MREQVERAILWTGLVLFAIFFLYPFWIAVWGGLKTIKQISDTVVYQPVIHVTLSPLLLALKELAWPIYHSVIIALTVTAIAIVGGIFGGYVLVRGRFRGIGIVFALVLFGMYIPPVTKLLPTLKIVQILGLYNTSFAVGVSVGSMMLPMSTILFRQFYQRFPLSYFEVASLEGGNHFDVLSKIIFPMSKVPAVTVAVLALGTGWNVFLFPLVLTSGSLQDRPIGVALSALRSAAIEDGTINEMLAAALIAALPAILLFLVAQRYVTAGFRQTGE